MGEELYFDGKKFISSKHACNVTGYDRDYVGQLCRNGKVNARRIREREWFVEEKSLFNYKKLLNERGESKGGKKSNKLRQQRYIKTKDDIAALRKEMQEGFEEIRKLHIHELTRRVERLEEHLL